jgi:hypothetical protein
MALKGPGDRLGTLMHMGPGFLPTALGIILIGLGIAIAGTALTAPESEDEHILPENPEWFGWSCILAGPLCFILFGNYFGLIPAIFSCVFVASLGDRTAKLKNSLYWLRRNGIRVGLFSYLLQYRCRCGGEACDQTALTDLWYGFGVALQPHNHVVFHRCSGWQHGGRARAWAARNYFNFAATDIRD